MKKKIFALVPAVLLVAISISFTEEPLTFTLSDGTEFTVSNVPGSNNALPPEVFDLVKKNKDLIGEKLNESNVSSQDLEKAVKEVDKVYNDNKPGTGLSYAPLTTTTNGLNDFTKDLAQSIANTQLVQNIWAEAWIGKFIPIKPKGFHIGVGANAGLSQMQIGALKETAKALEIKDLKDLPSFFAFPTVAADIRLGGIHLPFDVGFSFMTIDSTKISAIDKLVSPMRFDFYTMGLDLRWALLKGEGVLPKLSIGAGCVYTKGGFGMSSNDADASMNFKSYNIYAQAQLSKKMLFFIPFIGAKISYVKSDVDWNVSADWSNIFNSSQTDEIKKLQDWGFLPTKFEGGYDGHIIVPQVFCGFGLDIFIINLTFAAGYDFKNKLASAAVNVRIAW